MTGFTDYEPPRREVPVKQCYDDTLEGLEAARNHLDFCSRSLVNCFSSAESSNEQFLQARSKLAMLATVYMEMQFPLAVKVVKDLRNLIFLYNKYDVKKFKKNKGAMEEWITKHATSSAMLSKVQNLLLSDLERLRHYLEKTLESIKVEGARKGQECKILREDAEAEYSRFNAEAEDSRFNAQKLRCDADESARSREKADAESNVAAGLRLFVVVGAAGALLAAGPVVVAGGVVGGVVGGAIGSAFVGAGMTARGYNFRGKAEDFKKEAEAKQETAKKNGKKVAEMCDIAVGSEKKEKATANAERAAEKARIALRKGNQAADEAAREASECAKAVKLMKRDMPNSLTLFIKAMEKVSQFHEGLSSDIDSSLEQVRGMDHVEEHFTLFREYMSRIIKSCNAFERYRVIVRSRILPFLDEIDAVAISQEWISKHEKRGKLLQRESQNILELAFPARFPALTKHRLAWLKRVFKSAVRPFKHLGRH